MIEKMQTYLKYEKMPTGEMVEQLSANHSLEGLCFLKHCREGMQDNPNFPVVWKSSVEQSTPQLSLVQEDYEILDLIGGVLGGSDLQSQLGGLTLVSGLVKQNLNDANGQKETKGKLYRSLGVLSGIGIAVLVL